MANTKGTSVINNPQGGGAQSGLGEKFSPDLFTGTGNFSIPIAVPPGRNGFQPELTLGYSSGNGNGPFGMGWALGIPGVTRKTSKGIPVYDDRTDIFILSGAEDLVPVKVSNTINAGVSHEQTIYKPRTEGLFARIIRHKKSSGEHYWEVRSKDGLVSWYGTPDASADNDPAVIADPNNRSAIFAWHLTKTQDPFGNVILYNYERDLHIAAESSTDAHTYDQLYLSKIQYAQYPSGSITNYLCEVNFVYEDRPDPFSAYRQGFETRMVKRCNAVELYTNAASRIHTKTYHFNYQSDLPLNGASLLASVSVEGLNGTESESMPPLAFGYSVFDPAKRSLEQLNGPLPLASLGDPGFELVDLNGNGMPDLLQLNGTARYWTNKGNGNFSQPRNLNIAPGVQLGSPGVQMIDANGDGRTDLLVNSTTMSGYFPGAFHSVWDASNFRTYKQMPSFSFADPEVQLIDLDGDGITDVLRNGSRFECFYNDPVKGFYKTGTALKKFADFSFADPRIRFADMTGDGLQDIVLISSGRVQYWPNLGYGRFGKKVNMTNAPRFPEQYDPKQVLLGDLDGDGQADIAFVENNVVTLYVNQSGNSFSTGVKINNTPRIESLKGLRIIDIMGNGQAGILWSYGASGSTSSGRIYFLDLTKGNKPYVLQEMNNNMGSLTRVYYGSSVYHYLRDQASPDTQWKTDLPFPVQVVNRVEVFDFLSGGKLVTEYNYHNGYWDGVEREFRGFAHVDSTDTESFTEYTVPNPNTSGSLPATSADLTTAQYSPPTLTKSWFYVGPVGDGFNRWQEPDFSDEYWNGDVPVFERPLHMKDLLSGLPRRARRDALRTLRGSLLRSELYAIDGSALQNVPYTVTESLMNLCMKFDPSQLPNPLWSEKNAYWSGGGYVFFPFNIAQRTTQYERGTDPMHNFSFTKEYDAYGQPQGQLSVGVPRGLSPALVMGHYKGPFAGVPGNYLATYSLNEFIYKDDASTGQYMMNRVMRSRSWDVSQPSQGTDIFTLRDRVFAGFDTYPALSWVINYYDNLSVPFAGRPYGIIDSQGAQVRSESLVITDAIIGDAYSSTPPCFASAPNWTSGYPTIFAGLLQNHNDHLGYTKQTGGQYFDGWYAESSRLKYDNTYGLVIESKDVFDNLSTIGYDSYQVLPINSRQWIDGTHYLETTADHDYRVMQPYQVKDINNNYSEFDFSPLGLLRATALIGKGTEGDYKSSSGDFYSRYEPSVRMDYDFFAFVNSGDPVFVKTTSRELHYQQSHNSTTIIKVEYSDGFGRLLQTRSQAEDLIFNPVLPTGINTCLGSSGLPVSQDAPNAPCIATFRSGNTPMNVVVSGWKIYNNKGKVVEQYEPFFDKGFDYVLPGVSSGSIGGLSAAGPGVKIKMFYDPLGRVVKTVNPDNSQQWIIYGVPNDLTLPPDPVTLTGGAGCTTTPWLNFAYDANDLAYLTNPGSNVPSSHYFTPKSSETDALGRTIKTTEYFDNSSYNNTIDMSYAYDVRGNLLLVTDPYNRSVFIHKYDLRTPQKDQPLPPIYTWHIDKGESTALFDALGKPIQSDDAKGARTLSAYDTLQRPTNNWANDKTGDTITLRNYLVYGESATTPATYNLNGKAYKAYDEAGLVQTPSYDFKGNLLTKQRQVIDSATLKTYLNVYTTFVVDWTTLPSILDSTVYQSDMAYDALNRMTTLTLPTDVNGNRKQIVPGYSRAGVLEKISYDGVPYVVQIGYNAKGQRLAAMFGNGVMTRYAYDPVTFRLLRQRSEKYSFGVVGNVVTVSPTGGLCQDDGFNYDLVGNIMKIFERVSDCGISGSVLGSDALNREFDYDAIYRLTFANGRESNTQNGNNYLYDDAPAPGSPNASNVRYYSRTYTYDKLGNIQNVVQSGTNGFTRHFEYNAGKNTLEEINDGASTPVLIEDYTYDSNGNQLTAGASRNYAWNHADQLICYKNQVGTSDPTIYTQYDYAGQDRVSKLVRTGTSVSPVYERTIYIDGVFEYVKLENPSSAYQKNYVRVMDNKSQVAEVRIGDVFPGDISDSITYIIEDQIGSSVARISSSGTVIDKEEYYPFGDSSLRTFTYKRYRYVGKEKDTESGLYYYGARYYAAWTCRFISVDPLAGKYNWQSSYVYADNNPINKVDHNGMGTVEGEPKGGSEPIKTNPVATQSNNAPLAASTSGNQPKGFKGPDLNVDLSFLVKNNIAKAPVSGGTLEFKPLTSIEAKSMAINAQARTNYNFLSQHNEIELQAATNPVFQSIAQGALTTATGGLISRAIPLGSASLRSSYSFFGSSTVRSFVFDGGINAATNVLGQAAFNNGFGNIDYADVLFAFVFHKGTPVNAIAGGLFSAGIDLKMQDKPFVFGLGGGKKSIEQFGIDLGANVGFNFINNKLSNFVGKSNVSGGSFFMQKGIPMIGNALSGGAQSVIGLLLFPPETPKK